MSALRKAGVWLGLIEEEDDRDYPYDERSYADDYPDDEADDSASIVRARVADRLAEARAGREASTRSTHTEHGRSDRGRSEHSRSDHGRGARDLDSDLADEDDYDEPATPVRQIARQSADATRTARDEAAATRSRIGETYPTRDNLALAPATPQVTAPKPIPAQVEPEVRPVAAVVNERRYQITTLSPGTFNEARTIGEHFRDGVPVILNLTEMAEADAKRLVDFAAGLAFGLRGTMERVTNRVFLLSPANIQVTAEDKAKIAEGGFFRQ